jgi:beta-1,2-mannobiose phosphorylase / 1,2-beta-oligomannan phosphorylase
MQAALGGGQTMTVTFTRCPENPIVVPGRYAWRMATVFNPGVIRDGDGRFTMYERASGGLRPFHCTIGMLESTDGIHFRHVSDQPVFTPEMAGSRYGSVQDPRVVQIEGTYYMTYAFRPYAWNSHPTGLGVPESYEAAFPGFDGSSQGNQTRSGIAVSTDRAHWRHLCWATPQEVDDRDVILFPEKVNNKFVLLRRPLQFVSPDHSAVQAIDVPGIWVCTSDDLETWSDPVLLAKPEQTWEGGRIGGSTPPIKTEQGWLVFYHGVETLHAPTRRVCYRLGAMMLDLEDPTRVLARTRDPIMEPETYYERFGLYIPNVIFPTACVVVEGTVYLYYGVCDTAIALATAPLDALIEHVMAEH